MNRAEYGKLLNTYFRSVYNKLEADALLFNRRLPHEGLKGSENEQALADVLRDFLPGRYGVEANALVIDRDGLVSRQCDIVVYDNIKFPKYFRKVYPIEIVHAVIEVKTELSKQQVDLALQNEAALRKLRFQPLLSNFWKTKTEKEKLSHAPPIHCIFGYRSSTEEFGTFVGWFANLPTQTGGDESFPYHPDLNHFIACTLDKGIIFCRGDGHIPRWLAVAETTNAERNFSALADGSISKAPRIRLNGADIPVDLTTQNQVICVQEHYGTLIRKSHQMLQAEPNLELRELDRRWFTVPLQSVRSSGN
jgi:hypothetical protein